VLTPCHPFHHNVLNMVFRWRGCLTTWPLAVTARSLEYWWLLSILLRFFQANFQICRCVKSPVWGLLLPWYRHSGTRDHGMESTTGYCPPVWDLLLALA
jgi:hypothetical protein